MDHVDHPAVAALHLRGSIAQRTPEWYAARSELLTASDVAAALNIKPYASFRGSARAQALQRKLDNLAFSNAATSHGTKYEDEARDLAAAELGVTVHEFGLVVHATEPWLGASPDGVCDNGWMMEIKCPLRRAIVPGEVPEHYLPQLQVQMEVCDLDRAVFVEYKPACLGGPEIHYVMVDRDREWFARHRDAMHAFWREYMDRRPTHVRPAPPVSEIDLALYEDLTAFEPPPPVPPAFEFV